jgi:predicted amidohydrolase
MKVLGAVINRCIFRRRAVLLLCLSLVPFCSPAQYVGPGGLTWRFESPREELAGGHAIDRSQLYEGQPTLMLSGDGRDYADGRWVAETAVEAGAFLHFETHFLASAVEEPGRCILSRLIWLDASGRQVEQPEYPAWIGGNGSEGWQKMAQTYQVPAQARSVKIELAFRWDSDGKVHFGATTLHRVEAPESRRVRLASVYYRPSNSPSPQQNYIDFGRHVAQAAGLGAEIVCLPEAMSMVGTGLDYAGASEPVPGPGTDFLGHLAEKHGLYIVAGLLERDGPRVYNTAVLIGPDGRLSGKYRKVCLPREEIDGGVTPGDSLPVFDTPFGRIGMMICWDSQFPEPARELALKGAEVIFLPIAGGNTTLVKARAIENQVYIVSSSYDMETAVFDRKGSILSEASSENPVIVQEVDLGEQTLWPWLGDFKNRIIREMPAHKAID